MDHELAAELAAATPVWNLDQALLWIATRNESIVEHASGVPSQRRETWLTIIGELRSQESSPLIFNPRRAEEILLTALCHEELPAYVDGKLQTKIPPGAYLYIDSNLCALTR